ncbi:hypothetical protein ES332_A03G188300v1 [Gossypium tomentosum]|uniref:Expansin-like EG45 domain-containing protein n=1 Tax=Gossypium tomentosum TaxID=34277 RepID=A0A5D2R9S3_GOSTO|nr:hypothetical protein ES332_A03G188300v1 [Gossypium tomentosum]
MLRRCGFTEFVTLCCLLLLECLKVAGNVPFAQEVSDLHWHRAVATWYGSPEGDGSDGGACGYGSLVDVKPFRARVGAVSSMLFKKGEGCGACYKVRCLDKSICSRRAVTIIITDESPGNYGANIGRPHFDLSGAAFGHMAVHGRSTSGTEANSLSCTEGPHVNIAGRILHSMLIVAQMIIGYLFWWNMRMEMEISDQCI